MGWLAARKRRTDPQGAALAEAISGAINGFSWGQAAWLIDVAEHEVSVGTPAGPRTVRLTARWDLDEWLSDTIVGIKVQVVAGGRPRRGFHRSSASHPGKRLPAIPQGSVPVDLVALFEGLARQ